MPTPETGGQDWSKWRAKTSKKETDLEKQVDEATAQATFEGLVTSRSSLGRKTNLDYDPNAKGIEMVDKGAINIKDKSFTEMQKDKISALKHEVDMSNAVELGATGTDDEPFEIEHEPQRYKQTG
ncbi:MAG: hypothetical protein NTW66_00010 [Candidatus Magasanikbacteria bacterium]|nr:hypothetical protein [Candidatus Magasanikbacteria bacterium]